LTNHDVVDGFNDFYAQFCTMVGMMVPILRIFLEDCNTTSLSFSHGFRHHTPEHDTTEQWPKSLLAVG